jgi:ATP-dependent Clp endopeptidase proteolytic subunit ClpP
MQQVPDLDEVIRNQQARREMLDRFGVYFLRDIHDQEAERFCKSILLMAGMRKNTQSRDLTIYINSGGGSVGAGFAMMEILYKVKRDFGARIITIITGYAYSMGAILFQAGDHRVMGRLSTLMLHSPSWMISGEDHRIFQDYEKLSGQYKSVIGELFAWRTGRYDAPWWRKFIYSGRDRFLSPKECLKLGLVDEISLIDDSYPALDAKTEGM